MFYSFNTQIFFLWLVFSFFVPIYPTVSFKVPNSLCCNFPHMGWRYSMDVISYKVHTLGWRYITEVFSFKVPNTSGCPPFFPYSTRDGNSGWQTGSAPLPVLYGAVRIKCALLVHTNGIRLFIYYGSICHLVAEHTT